MLIVICTEFPQDSYFQWRWVWNLERQVKFKVLVKSILMDAPSIERYPINHSHWNWLRKADVVFCYCSRSGERNVQCKSKEFGKDGPWLWFELPFFAKKIMRPEAKLVVQFDDDLIWVFHQDWNWFEDKPDDHGGPDQFFMDTGLLEIADIYFTVLEHPPWGKYSTKPIRYMPLPHLWRYDKYIINTENIISNNKSLRDSHSNYISLLRHSSVIAEIQHEIDNVLTKFSFPIFYFSMISNPKLTTHNLSVKSFPRLGRDLYMENLQQAFLALEDCDNYIGWSRFAMECAMLGIPCIGSSFAIKLFFPDLYTEHKDYARQIELINCLSKDRELYERVAREGFFKCIKHLDGDYLCEELLKSFRELNISESVIDIDKEIFLSILDKMLPWDVPPRRPNTGETVVDPFCHYQITQKQWDAFYGPYSERFINDEKAYKAIIREALDRKDERQ